MIGLAIEVLLVVFVFSLGFWWSSVFLVVVFGVFLVFFELFGIFFSRSIFYPAQTGGLEIRCCQYIVPRDRHLLVPS